MSTIIHNASFVIERELEETFVEWLREEIPALVSGDDGGYGASNPRISAMREAGGVDYTQAEAQSVAFQVEFPDLDAASRWSRERFSGLAGKFHARFGSDSMVFTSLFQTIDL